MSVAREKVMFMSVFFILFFLLTLPVFAEGLEGGKYYVSPTGDDASPGTVENPWKTIQHAADIVEAGDTVVVRGGIYSELVHLRKSGSKDKGNITFQSFPGETPILDGKKINLKLVENSSFFFIDDASYIRIEGFELRNLKTKDPDTYPAGILVEGGSSYITLSNNHIHHIENTSKKGNAHGILFYGNSPTTMSNITINNNEIHHLKLGNSETLALIGNIRQFTIIENEIHHNNNIGIDVAGFYNDCEEKNCVDQARDGVVANNNVYENSSKRNASYKEYSAAGIYADGSTRITIKNNIVSHNDFGIELASENAGKTTSEVEVKNNVIYSNNGAGIIAGGAEQTNGGASNNIIANNFLLFNDRSEEGYGEITMQWNTRENRILNNKIFSKEKDEYIQNEGTDAIKNIYMNNTIHSFEEKPSLLAPVSNFFHNLRWW